MKPRRLITILFSGFLIILHSSFLIPHSFGQDHPPITPSQLPFQQDAPKPGDEEKLAMQFLQNRDFEQAAAIYERLMETKTGHYFYNNLFYCLVEIRDFKKAEKLAKKQMKDDPRSLKYLVDIGYLYFREGNEEKARKHYEEALKKLPADQGQINEMANAFLSRGENEYALRTYEKGKQLMNQGYPFSYEIAAIYERMGDYLKAINAYLDLLGSNPAYMNVVQDRFQNMLANDPDHIWSESLRKSLLIMAQKEPEKTCYAELLWWYSVQQKDFKLALIQVKALDRRNRENGERVWQLARLAASNEFYQAAVEAYQYLIAKGVSGDYYEASQLELINTRYLLITSQFDPPRKQLDDLEKEFKGVMQKNDPGETSISLMRNLAHLEAFYLGKADSAIILLEEVVEMNGIRPENLADIKMELGDILLFKGNIWEATLLYQQVYQDFKNDAMGQTAKFKNARLSFYIGEFKWAGAQLDILKAATSKLIANDAMALSLLITENYDPDSNTVALEMYARAELLDFRNDEDRAMQSLDSIQTLFGDHPILDEVLYKKAAIKLKQRKFKDADSLLSQLVTLYPDGILADKALMERADLNDRTEGDQEKAKQLYQELLEKYPGSIFIPAARKRFRELRGDHLN